MSNSNHENGQMRCDPHRLERNNYFTGKLLTPRDFIAEQAYHAGTGRTTARAVLGTGSVCGLGVDPALHPTDADAEPDRLDVTVTPGLAIDGCGRLVVVDEAVTESFDLPVTADGEETNDVSVYVKWRECATESVPRTGMENACETECAPNRFVEYGEVTVVPGPPDAAAGAVGDIDFPDRETVLGIHRAGSDDIGVALDAVPVVLPPADAVAVAGKTTAGAGTAVDVELTFPDGETTERSAEVALDGTFAVTVDASAYEPTTRFTATVSVGGTVLEVPGVVGDRADEPFVDDPTVLFDAAQSYYAANRGACSFAEGPVLVGTLHRENGQPWDLAVFERGPIVYGNKLLYAAVASHAADFDNPHQVSLELDTVEVVDADGDGDDNDVGPGGDSVELDSNGEYPQGQTLVAEAETLAEDQEIETYELRGVDDSEPGNFVGDLGLVDDTIQIDTSELPLGQYVVTPGGAEEVVFFDNGEAVSVGGAGRTSAALFTVVPGEASPPEPEPVEESRVRLSVPGFDGSGGDVFLTSTDGSVSITPHLGARTVDLAAGRVGGGLTADQRAYLRERSLLNAAESFDSVGIDAALIADVATGAQGALVRELIVPILFIRREVIAALVADDHADATEFRSVFTRPIQLGNQQATLVELETLLGSNLEQSLGQTPPGLQVYIEATELLASAVGATAGSDEERALAVAVAQDRVAEAAKLLLITIFMVNIDIYVPGSGSVAVAQPQAYLAARTYATGPVSAAYVEAADAMDTMPDLTGLTRDEAELRLAIRGHDPNIVSRSVDDTGGLSGIGVNDVEKQSPAPGAPIQPGTDLTIEVVETPGVRAVRGIGDEFASSLEGANVATVYDVSNASVETLVEATGASERTVREWKANATLLTNGYRLTRAENVDAEVAATLVRALGVSTEEELAVADGEEILAALETARGDGRIPQASLDRAKRVDWGTVVSKARQKVDPELLVGATVRGGFGSFGGLGGGFQPPF